MITVAILRERLLGQLRQTCQEVYGQSGEGALTLTYPPHPKLGDFAVPCFALAKQLGISPNEIALTLASRLPTNDYLVRAQAAGSYVNLRLKAEAFFGAVGNDQFGGLDFGRDERVMVEYLSPNTNKPLHLGHARNGVLGMAVANLLAATGHQVVKANLVNDRGVHICKSMWAYQNYGGGETPQSAGLKGDHFVGRMYVLFAQKAKEQPALEETAQGMLKAWEAGDPELISLWRRMNQWVYDGFAATYATLGFEFDVFYYESETYKLGKDIVAVGLARRILFRDENGQVTAEVPAEAYERPGSSGKPSQGVAPKKAKRITLLRSDGTSLYMTQDLGTAVRKFEEHGLTRSIYVVGREQDFHFQSLFSILHQLGYEWATRCYHLSYGMVYLPEGKMKSREGIVIDADQLVADMTALARQEIEARTVGISESVKAARALSIALAAIKFFLLRQNPQLNINFNPQESLSFEGVTGPYCQYTYARAKSIMRRSAKSAEPNVAPDFGQMTADEERLLGRNLMQWEEVLARAAREYNPAALCNWLYETAKAFNRFYHAKQVVGPEIGPELSAGRLVLVRATALALRRGLEILGIDAIEEM